MGYRRRLSDNPQHALNAICPYFTMFPLEFPLRIMRRHRSARFVLDPFCGRGTTLYAARYCGIAAAGIDCSPVAVAISQAKLARFSLEQPLQLAERLIAANSDPDIPEGDFWECAFDPQTLRDLCRLRAGLLARPASDTTILLRAAVLGVLHGPSTKVGSYLSNQMQRTFSPKPAYAVHFWRRHRMRPHRVDVVSAIRRKLERIEGAPPVIAGHHWRRVRLGDSASRMTYRGIRSGVDLVITSPPYYGMRTYVADQWLRNWFLGGPAQVDYSDPGDLPSSSPEDFTEALAQTWANVAAKGAPGLHLYVRFGAIPSRAVSARDIILESLAASGAPWRLISIRNARTAEAGKRQVEQMRTYTAPLTELDLHAALA